MESASCSELRTPAALRRAFRKGTNMTNEFQHYDGCKHNDPENCGACALTDKRQAAPNYAGWPLAYIENHRSIPAKWRAAFKAELARTDNPPYVANIRAKMAEHGFHFTDSKPL